MREWYKMSAADALKALETNAKGLRATEAASRLQKYGLNELQEAKKTPSWVLFLNQFRDILVIILIAAAIISAVLREFLDAFVILIVIVLNAIFGFVQERRAENALEALKKLSSQKAQVFRDGKTEIIDSKELVPGDIIILNVGDKVPADCRVIEEFNLKVDESVLTGESVPVSKNIDTIKTDAPVAERRNMLFSGTAIVYGRCIAVAVETGMLTEFGKIASILQQEDQAKTPLKQKLEVFGKQLSLIILGICVIIFALGIWQGKDIVDMFLTAVSLAVAAIPEGLPAVVTITLAIGLLRMAKRNVIVRKLASVETLGSTTVIASDKTGTLTMNQMTVRKLYANDEIFDVTGQGYDPSGKFIESGKEISANEDMKRLLSIGLLCNDAKIEKEVIGDPTEAALVVSARKAKIPDLRETNKRIAEAPFDSQRKMMSVVCSTDSGRVMYTKGAVEEVLKRCSGFYHRGKVERLTEEDKKRILSINEQFAKQALRVLGFATKIVSEGTKVVEEGLIFAGMQAMIDPPRSEVKDALEKCDQAGIKVLMITGDHKETAIAVANELDMLKDRKVLTGSELDKLSDAEYLKIVNDIAVYARVSPEHKVRITEALKKKGHIVAMTGDGVNDAPALKKADIGIAMGITGTDVTKEASSMVLTDDNFASIVAAVEEGRGIFDNIKKFINYLLAANIGEVLIMLLAILLFKDSAGLFVLPLLPLQLLWVNLVTDTLPALALGVEPIERDVMKRKPRNPKEKVMNRESMNLIIFASLLMAAATLLQFYIEFSTEGLEKARAVAFTTIVLTELFIALSVRSHMPLHKIGIFSNKKLLVAVLVSFALQLAVLYVPFLNPIFDTVPITVEEWAGILAVSLLVFAALEARKIILTRKIETDNNLKWAE
ncbi:MAG: calcium-transporting P-type ATPase, PMR1-type [Candidatus Aenigmarchaeota archaeon]|nr:calcium-transporting P-type ATPase, PMR1-type [Candidatus Aenigmarchaeota archaeon]